MKTFEAENKVWFNTSGKGNWDKVKGSEAGGLDSAEQNNWDIFCCKCKQHKEAQY